MLVAVKGVPWDIIVTMAVMTCPDSNLSASLLAFVVGGRRPGHLLCRSGDAHALHHVGDGCCCCCSSTDLHVTWLLIGHVIRVQQTTLAVPLLSQLLPLAWRPLVTSSFDIRDHGLNVFTLLVFP